MGKASSGHGSELNETIEARFRPAMRLLKMAHHLAASAEGRSVPELMQEFELGRRTTQRMVAALHDMFTVERIDDGRYRRYRISAGLSAFLLAPSAEKLANLELAAQMFHERGEHARAESLRDLGRRNVAALREGQRSRLAPDIEALTQTQLPVATPGPHVAVEPWILSTCQMAVTTTYLTGSFPSPLRPGPYGPGMGFRDVEDAQALP